MIFGEQLLALRADGSGLLVWLIESGGASRCLYLSRAIAD